MSKAYFIKEKAISVNEMRKGRTFLTEKYKDFKSRAVLELLSQRPKLNESKNITMVVTFYLKEMYRNDVDNFAKGVLDSCKEAGLFSDDRYITTLILKKKKALKDSVEIEIIDS